LHALACASGLALAVPQTASADQAKFDIAAQPLPKALKAFASQARMQLLYPYAAVDHAVAHPVHGQLEKHLALEELLRGTGLKAVYSNYSTATIRPAASADGASPAGKPQGARAPRKGSATGSAANGRGSLRLANSPAGGMSRSDNSAADAVSSSLQEVIVIGEKESISNALRLKRNAGTIVDSVSASDIGAFPDKSAASALERLPGITVNSLQSNDDSSHPSGEPTGVLIRGLPQVRTESNGRDTFSADSGRGLNFNDVSPELLSRIEAYKNQTADMIEGGLVGTVNLVTREPFDQNGPVLVGSAEGDYDDRSTKLTPDYSVLGSDTWSTDIGRFGLLGDYARSHVVTRTESVIMDKIDTYCSSGYGTATHALVNSDGTIPCTSNPFGGTGWAFAPDGVRYSQVDYDRHRTGLTGAAQYANPSNTVLATVQYSDSVYHNAWLEDASHAILDGSYYGTPAFDPRGGTLLGPADGTGPLEFASNGMLVSGTLTQPHGSWLNSNSPSLQQDIDTGSAVPGMPFVNDCGPGLTCSTQRDGLYFQNETRDFDHSEGTKDLSADIKWNITSRLHSDFDAQYIKAYVSNNDILVATGSMANYQYSVNSDGTPQITLLPGSNVNYAPGGLSNPHNYWIPFIQGHMEDDGGTETAYRGDFTYDLNQGSWLDSLKAGVRFADRRQEVRYSAFNWTPVAASWNCNGPGFNADNTTPAPYPAGCGGGQTEFNGYGAGIWGTQNFSSFYDGSVYPNGNLVFLNNGTITNYNRVIQATSGAATSSPIPPGYVPICDRQGATVDGCFLPSEAMHIEERTKAAYLMLNFGGNNANLFARINVVGNVGARVVRTEEISSGSVEFPAATDVTSLAPCDTPLAGGSVVNPSCYLTPAIVAFANSGGSPSRELFAYTNVLPSFNVRLGLDPEDFVRFAYSKAMSRPDIGLLRNYVQVTTPELDTSAESPYVVYNSPTAAHIPANVVGYNFVFMANAGNTGLRPETADQFDLSFERYFSAAGALTLDFFYKKLWDALGDSRFTRDLTNNGSTQPVEITGPVNVHDGGRLSGAELDFETYFKFLPGLLKGLGMQATYTYVQQSGISNTNLVDNPNPLVGGQGSYGAGVSTAGGVVIDSHALAGVSKHSFNLVGLYEYGPFGVRLAYNWRSRYLTDNLDCCIGLPVFQKAAGYLDGSLRYSIGKHVALTFDVANILDTTTVYQQQIFGDSSATPGARPVYMDSAWSRAGRRYELGVRAKF
jgi:TonB-dependent receptor